MGATAILTHDKLFSRLFGNSCDKLGITTVYTYDNSFSFYTHVYATTRWLIQDMSRQICPDTCITGMYCILPVNS